VLVGFATLRGSFSVSIHKNKELKTGWRVQPVFQIHLGSKDLEL
jgi:hypothetical protein